MEDIVQWFRELPRYMQFLVIVGLATPIFVLNSYLNPPPPPPPPPPPEKLSVRGDVTVQRRTED